MKKLTYLFLALIIVACSDDEGNPCLYNPTLTTSAVTNITETIATLNGVISIVSDNCDNPNNTEQGFVYATTIQPTTANNMVNVNGTNISTTLENLEPNTTYYTRTFLTNVFGEFYGNEVSFITSEEPSDCEVVYLAENGITIKACDDANVGDTGVIGGVTFTVVDEAMLRAMVANEEDVTKVVTTFVTEMSELFYLGLDSEGNIIYNDFNQDLSSWDVINVTDMRAMFAEAETFDQDISSWNVSNVTDMSSMFSYANFFNQPIGNWDMSNVTEMNSMFQGAYTFNQNIGDWDVSSLTSMTSIFNRASAFNQDISNWDVSNVTTMDSMFYLAPSFNQPIGNWDVSSVTDMSRMFYGATSFNQPIGDWDVSNVTSMRSMFSGLIEKNLFNQDISTWDVSNVTEMNYMFKYSFFNQPIGNWDVSSVTDMSGMFSGIGIANMAI